jgi:hypothetical protein
MILVSEMSWRKIWGHGPFSNRTLKLLLGDSCCYRNQSLWIAENPDQLTATSVPFLRAFSFSAVFAPGAW